MKLQDRRKKEYYFVKIFYFFEHIVIVRTIASYQNSKFKFTIFNSASYRWHVKKVKLFVIYIINC